ncbi:hypothetical protein [Saccharothrix australiensis]|uniref:Uncharacterized protein n=1 Tax=Saccharothrix australiensis TaxID=2072 RepID=A0A495W4A1_9PSEU|nr:hypothetical protein [Saccharothrix australiensis]RKT55930.1 hypothetical protein C8E97_4618 [Saccharothrix australiensis]
MSVPPQQPDPYGQQPGQPGEQPGRFGGQPGYGRQPGGFPPPPQDFPQGGQQQPGYGPPSGGFPPPGQPGQPYGQPQPGQPYGQPGPGQPYGQPGPGQPYGQPGQFSQQFNQPGHGQPGPYGPQPGGYGDPYGAPRRKSPLPWLLAGGGVLVIGLVVVLVLTLGGGSNGTPKDAADSFAAAMSSKDYDKLRSLTCAEDKKEIDDLKKAFDPDSISSEIGKNLDNMPPELRDKAKRMQEAAKNVKIVATVKGVEEKDATHAEADISIKLEGLPEELKELVNGDTSNKIPFIKTDDGWVACEKK